MSCSKSRNGIIRRNVDSWLDVTRNGLRLSSWRCMWMWRRRSVSTSRHKVSNRSCKHRTSLDDNMTVILHQKNLGKPVPEYLLTGFFGAKDDAGGGVNWSYKTCKASVKSSPLTNQRSLFQAGCPSCHPTKCVRALKENIHVFTCMAYYSKTAYYTSSSWNIKTIRK